MEKLTINLVTFNGARYLPALFLSLRNQIFQDWRLVVVDNASTDNTVAVLKAELTNLDLPFELILNPTNTGFTGGYNQALKKNLSELSILINQDLYLDPHCLSELINASNREPQGAVFSPRLMRWNFSVYDKGEPAKSFTDYVDSLGLKVFRNRRCVENFTGLNWNDLKNKFNVNNLAVFGVSGTMPMFRRGLIQAIGTDAGDLFDPEMFLYKEDVDLAYRAVSASLKSFVVLSAVAYHDRTAASNGLGDRASAKNKTKQSASVKKYSYRNHWWVLLKNEYGENLLLDFPFILWYEFKKFIYFFLFDRAVLVAFLELWDKRKQLKQARRFVVAHRKVPARTVRVWWAKKSL